MCCELFTHASHKDFDRWLDEDRLDIISCLTWQRMTGRTPKDLLIIPQKRHIVGHNYLRKFYQKEWGENKSCIFLNDEGRCRIYKTRPDSCRNFPRAKLSFACPGLKEVTELDKGEAKMLARNKLRDNLKVYKNREILSKVIKKSKEQCSLRKLARLMGITPSEAVKEEDDARKEQVRTIGNLSKKVDKNDNV